MTRLVVVLHHSPTASTRRLTESVLDGATDPHIEGVEVEEIEALHATADDVRRADGLLIGTPVNFGYMSGALKHFFDRSYRDLLEPIHRVPVGLWVKGSSDASGAVRALIPILRSLDWRLVGEPLVIEGEVDARAQDAAYELGATLAAHLTL